MRKIRGTTYQVIVFAGLDNQGKKKYKWVTCKTKREAQNLRAEMVHQSNTGALATPKGTLSEFTDRWLKEYAQANLSPRTYEGYESIYRYHIKNTLGNISLKNLKPDHIQNYYASRLDRGLSTTTVRHHAMLIHRILEHAVKWQLLIRNPADAVTPPVTRHTEMHTLDKAQAELLLNELEKTPYYALFHTALFTGMRRSELLALRWQDIDLNMAEISVSRSMHRLKKTHEIIFRGTKTAKSSRTIALAPDSCQVLRKHLDNEMTLCNQLEIPLTSERLVFCTTEGRELYPDSVSQVWGRTTKRLGMANIRMHDIRHTHASLMLKQGIHPKVVQERLGHSSITITLDTYSHVTPGLQQKAAEAIGVCENTVYSLVKSGKLQAVKLPRRIIIPVTSLEKFLSQTGEAVQR